MEMSFITVSSALRKLAKLPFARSNDDAVPDNYGYMSPSADLIQERLDFYNVEADVLFPQAHDETFNLTVLDESVEARRRESDELKASVVLDKVQTSRKFQTRHAQKRKQKFHKLTEFPIETPRCYLYSAKSGLETSVSQLLSDQGRLAIEEVLATDNWWVDVLSPTDEELRVLKKVFHIHALTAEDIQAREQCEKVAVFPNYIFVCSRSFDVDPHTGRLQPYNFYNLIFKKGLLTRTQFHFNATVHPQRVRRRANHLREYASINPDWMNYALIDDIVDSFMPVVQQVQMESISIDELSLLLRKDERADMLKRIGRCRRRATQLLRLLSAKVDGIKSLMKRYEDKPALGDIKMYLDHVLTMSQNTNHYSRMLARAHTNYLAQVNVELSHTYSMTNKVMNRLTFLGTVFIPLHLISSLWGMNVKVPGDALNDTHWFYWIMLGMAAYWIAVTYFGKVIKIL
ncbi:CorA metal ion transporter [Apophysomyces ossiformis]|uniref:CorA metal ion transporter n=1 Tax=Apophysomyces ossiformis TaxID=679940 RepID=A0A8H7ESB7_9FUNG|nr:CorA metal ion transporter [Apophysomyces ossiformis]